MQKYGEESPSHAKDTETTHGRSVRLRRMRESGTEIMYPRTF